MPKLELDLTDEQLEDIKKLFPDKFKSAGYFVPKNGEDFFVIHSGGNVFRKILSFSSNNEYITTGMYAKTEEEAKHKVAVMKAIQRVKVWIDENIGTFEPDWNNFDEDKYTINYNLGYKVLNFYCDTYDKQGSQIGHLKNVADCHKLIEAMREDLELIYK